MAVLSGDVLLVILDFLKDNAANHSTLLHCALASKWFAEPTLSILYQSYDSSPVFGGGTEEEHFRRPPSIRLPGTKDPIAKVVATFQKWLLMWKSIILSTSEGKTYLPYCKYIRYLDLDDFREVLTHTYFAGKIRDDFFSSGVGDLIHRNYEIKGQKRLRSSNSSLDDTSWVIERVGSLISEKAHQVRELRGNISGDSLRKWIINMPKLETLDLWTGASFSEKADECIRDHCPDFKNLSVFRWSNPENGGTGSADAEAERVLKNLRPDTLRTFETISLSFLGPRFIASLGCHLNSLKTLAMTNLPGSSIHQFANLGAAKALKKLVLTDIKLEDDVTARNEAISAMGSWMCQCESLTRLELRNFNMQDEILISRLLADKRIHLEALEMQICDPANIRSYFNALSCQASSLRILFLEGIPDWFYVEEKKAIQLETICKLGELRELDIRNISKFYDPENVRTLTRHLTKLEKLSISGAALDDDLWDDFLHLENLRYLSIHGTSNFSGTGILDFVQRLGPNNRGFNLLIAGYAPVTDIPIEDQYHINAVLAQDGGAFDYEATAFLEEDFSDSEDSFEWREPIPIIDINGGFTQQQYIGFINEAYSFQ